MNRIDYDERRTVYREALRMYGTENQIAVAIEEMSELTKELCKAKRNKGKLAAIAEEIADVTIMLEQLKLIYDVGDSVELWMDMKIRRLQEDLGMKVTTVERC